MSPRGTSPVPGSASTSSRVGGAPGVSWNMGKESTSVGRSTPRCSRLMAWIPASSVNSTSTSQGKDTPSASSAAGITRRSSPA